MPEVHVGVISDFDDAQRKRVVVDGHEIIILRHDERFYAYKNVCLHMGGPVAEGILIPKVEAVMAPDGRQLGERFDETEMHLVCPWHGFEYDLETGEYVGNRRMKLRKFSTEQRGDDVYLIV